MAESRDWEEVGEKWWRYNKDRGGSIGSGVPSIVDMVVAVVRGGGYFVRSVRPTGNWEVEEVTTEGAWGN